MAAAAASESLRTRIRLVAEQLLKRPRVVVATIATTVALALAGVAAAEICGNAGGSICCDSQVWLPFRNICCSSWNGTPGLHYYARRRNDSFELTYNHYQYNGGTHFFDNGSDVWRGTGIYRAGEAQMDFTMTQSSRGGCFG